MYYRSFGATGASVSEIGLGCNRLGESHEPDEHWIKLVERAIECTIGRDDLPAQLMLSRGKLEVEHASGRILACKGTTCSMSNVLQALFTMATCEDVVKIDGVEAFTRHAIKKYTRKFNANRNDIAKILKLNLPFTRTYTRWKLARIIR